MDLGVLRLLRKEAVKEALCIFLFLP